MDQSDVLATVGWNGIFSIFVTLGCVAVAWFVLHEVNFDRFVKHPRSPRARLLQLLIAIVLGHSAARFVLDYWTWAGTVKWLFGAA
ncbi:DUF1146 domain-containing protein [Cohnella sp. GCM10027633]|uniref:DUF1146 domain-containing protein n=1 Tax=unclassified Cohnella TaxID=2636738 RepID=UPI003631AFD8